MSMHPGDNAAGRAKLNMPADFVANFESVHHDVVPFRVKAIEKVKAELLQWVSRRRFGWGSCNRRCME
jgi:hypothetical protein